MRHELFVYYRVRSSHAQALAAAVADMHRTLRAAHPGLDARLLRRADEPGGETTWMETYALPAGADPAALRTAIEAAARALAPWLAGERHVEHFVPCAW
ncbi:MAG TPA: DUF4936 family protein [Methylibium sp.]|uniref:DUF4936 family protein n=1 Tax=Methylibium sp. TaxID=2067992 RepID=UPI002DBFE7D3|nr:DUF4936 family protein [Methylibium sp.]HEU4460613.1 DUF4936 family protein [Methylibium sp.]